MSVIKLIKKIYSFLSTKLLMFKMILRFSCVSKIQTATFAGFVIRGAKKKDIEKIKNFYQKCTGRVFTNRHIYLLQKCEEKICIITEKETQIVGFDLFYMNSRDFKQKTVHEGFIGVLPDYEGKGIATSMRKHAIEHFKKAGFNGISTRISINNIRSLKSAEKLGFKVFKQYFDSEMNEERYYLICNF